MSELLIKLFIKNQDEVHSPRVRTAYGLMVSSVGIVCNLILFLLKLFIGIMLKSISVMADAFNNLSDAASSIISFVGVKLANRPADKEHPFGHGRYEYISALIVAFLIFQVGFSCLKSSISKIMNPEQVTLNPFLVAILLISVGIKIWLALFNKKIGNRINSNVMKAASADSIGDVLVTSVTIISLIVGYYTGLSIDGYMGVIVSVFVFIAGFSIAKDTLEPLLGEAIDKDLYEKITSKVESYDKIVGTHDLVVHNYGPTHTMATIHCEVPNDIDIEVAHEIIDKIERDILREDNIFIVIHTDPVEVNNELVLRMKQKIYEIVTKLEERATMHDFRVVNGDNQINVLFDLVVPHDYNEKSQLQLRAKIIENVAKMDDKLCCIISLEKSFVSET